jgi:hypothetical protein
MTTDVKCTIFSGSFRSRFINTNEVSYGKTGRLSPSFNEEEVET